MMNRCQNWLGHLATVLFVWMWLVVLVSWIADVYGLQITDTATGDSIRVQSVLSAEGIRWWIRAMIPNFTRYAAPEWVIVMTLGIGLALHAFAGYKPRSRKNRRALEGAMLAGGAYLLLILLATFSPWGILRGANGGLLQSPFMDGLPFLVSLGVGLSGVVYGFASGRYRRDKDVLAGLTYLMPWLGIYFALSFIVSQLLGCLSYAQLDKMIVIAWHQFIWQ